MRNIAGNVLTILVAAGLALVIAVGYAKREFSAAGPLEEDVVVFIQKGSGLRDTSRQLALHGAIEDSLTGEWLFRVGARYSSQDQGIRYGEYRIPAKASMEEILDLLVSGKSIQHKVTVAEGLSSFEIVELLRANEILTGEIEEIPPEGSLAPETYFIQRNQNRREVLARMETAQQELVEAAWAQRIDGLPLSSPQELLILASIVEKETGVASERAKVASVFINRLQRGMRLQSDPTVVYGINEGKGPLGRGLRRSELDRVTPYNTYAVDGLPPTPIASPGRAAIMAVVNPEVTDFLYFVADGSGGHAFARTLDEHNANVARWRKIEQNTNN